MYEGGSYLTPYCRRYCKKEEKVRAGKRMLVVSMAVGLTVLSVCAMRKLPFEEIRTALVHKFTKISDIQVAEPVVMSVEREETASEDRDQATALGDVLMGKPQETLTTAAINDNCVVFVDAGHGGMDEGCAKNGVQEKTVNLAIARIVREKLEEAGYEVIMSREEDVYVTKEERVRMANASQADIYVSIHQNAAEDSRISGMEVWYDGADETRDNRRLSQLVSRQTAGSTQAVERALRPDAEFHVTGSTTMPACLIEAGFLTNPKERARLVTPEYQDQVAEGIVQGIEYYFHPKTMYLTFDDGPSAENTARVLDILKARGIRATFFLVGENVRSHPEMARRIVEEGHTIGIHSDTHDYEKIYQSVDSFVEDFEAAHQTVYEVTGVDTKLFRFPGGSVNAYNKRAGKAIIKEMTKRGYIYYDWNASLEDAAGDGAAPDVLVERGVETTLGRKTVVLLAHDVIYNTGLCLNDLLDSLPEYQMLPLDEKMEPVQF